MLLFVPWALHSSERTHKSLCVLKMHSDRQEDELDKQGLWGEEELGIKHCRNM